MDRVSDFNFEARRFGGVCSTREEEFVDGKAC